MRRGEKEAKKLQKKALEKIASDNNFKLRMFQKEEKASRDEKMANFTEIALRIINELAHPIVIIYLKPIFSIYHYPVEISIMSFHFTPVV